MENATSLLKPASPKKSGEMIQGSIPFAPKEINYKVYKSADEIEYSPESALQEGVAMVREVKHHLKKIELGSKLRKDVWMNEVET